MPSPASPGQSEVIIGVDTHQDFHVACMLSGAGAVLGTARFPATAAGYRQLLARARGHGPVARAGVEGTGSYGAGLARYLTGQGVAVTEVSSGDAAERRRRGKTDEIDAEAAARAVLSGRAAARAKTGDGPAEAARMLRLARSSALQARTRAMNQLRAVLVTASPALRESLAGLGRAALIRACAALAPPAGTRPGDPAAAAVLTLTTLARRITALTAEADEMRAAITAVITAHAPRLLARYAVGPDTAAALLAAAGDNPARLHSEAAFAALCGASPVPASSGKTTRHRLNRGGDRQANNALYTIAIVRLSHDPATRAYAERRTAEGKTRREIIRCLKRYIARQLYHDLTTTPA